MSLRTSAAWLFAGVLLISAGCVSLKQPLSDPEAALADPALIGSWKVVPKPDQQDPGRWYLFVGREDSRPIDPNREEPESGLMHAITVGFNDAQQISSQVEQYRFFVTEVGDSRYASMVIEPQDSEDETARQNRGEYWLLKYEVDGDNLTVWLCDIDKVAKLVEAGELAGKVNRGRVGTSVMLTTEPEELRNYLAGGGDAKMFSDEVRLDFRRMEQ